MDIFVLATQYLFLITALGMAGATAFLWIERGSVAEEYRSAITVSGIYTAIAGFMYWQMHTQVGLDGDINSVLELPTYVRYIDWIITTPLILLAVALVLGLPEKRLGLVFVVIVVDLAMIIFGYFGELYSNQEFAQFQAWTMFGLSCLAFLLLLFIVLSLFADVAGETVEPVQRAFKFMTLFIAVGWLIYPVGFLFGMSDIEGMKVAREFVYNIADIINKVGLGLVTFYSAKSITRDMRIRETMNEL